MQYRNLRGLRVSALGLGCMGMSDFYAQRDENLAALEVTLDAKERSRIEAAFPHGVAAGARYPAAAMAAVNR